MKGGKRTARLVDVQQATRSATGVTLSALRSPSRKKELVCARHAFVLVAVSRTHHGGSAIARYLNRDPSTICYILGNKIGQLPKSAPLTAEYVQRIEHALDRALDRDPRMVGWSRSKPLPMLKVRPAPSLPGAL